MPSDGSGDKPFAAAALPHGAARHISGEPAPESQPIRTFLLVLLLLLGPVLWSAGRLMAQGTPHWSTTRWDSTGLAPDPARTPEAVVQVYAARTWGWKGAFAVHSWLVTKAPGAASYNRYEVVAWGVRRGGEAIRRNMRPPDARWAGNEPELVLDLRGEAAAAAIPKIEAAIAAYPYQDSYVTWPGPNSNSFVAHVMRAVPELRAELPSTAIGKDFLANGQLAGLAPSKTGFQVSFAGLLGVTLAVDEGLEVNVLGLVLGVDPLDLAIKLPGIGRIGLR
ncbi:MAG: DUF3750 domain-containing protein [Geminicoccaceae bacterium]